MLEQQKEMAKRVPILQVAQLLPFHVRKKGRYYSFVEHDSVVIDPRRNAFWHNSQHVAGDPIRLLMHFGGYSFKSAIRAILDAANTPIGLWGSEDSVPMKRKTSRFEIPKLAVDKDNVLYTEDIEKFLTTQRCLSPNVIRYMIRTNRLLQQSLRAEHFTRGRFKNACLFFGFPDGIPVGKPNFCERRTIFPEKGRSKTLTVPGSDTKHGFYVNNGCPTIVVTEGILDFMAIMTILDRKKINFLQYDYLALIGASKTGVVGNILKEQPHIRRIIICLDNDEAGRVAAAKLMEMLQSKFPEIRFVDHPAKGVKDYNDVIMQGNLGGF